MKTQLTILINILGAINPVFAAIVGTAAAITAMFSYFNTVWANLFARLDALVGPSLSGGADLSPLGLVNTFIPLSEMLTFLVAYIAVYLTASAIRMVKAFVPTVA